MWVQRSTVFSVEPAVTLGAASAVLGASGDFLTRARNHVSNRGY